jgi:hypothetical protein
MLWMFDWIKKEQAIILIGFRTSDNALDSYAFSYFTFTHFRCFRHFYKYKNASREGHACLSVI